MKLVLQHPGFKENPFGAIATHLNNTLPEGRDNSGMQGKVNGRKVGGGGKGEEEQKMEGGKKRNGSRKRKDGRRR